MCGGVVKSLLGGAPASSAPVAVPANPAQNTAASTTAVAELKKRNRSLLSAAGAVGDTSNAITSSGAAIGKTALGA